MCLTVSKAATIKALNTRKFGTYVVRWKRVRVAQIHCQCLSFPEGDKILVSEYYRTHIWREGWNKSNLPDSKKAQLSGSVHKGIHVFNKPTDVHFIAGKGYTRLSVRCYAEDLIGVDGCHTETYKRVFVTKQAIVAALKLAEAPVVPVQPTTQAAS